MQEAWDLYPEPQLTLRMQGSTAEPHPGTLEPSEGDAGGPRLFDWVGVGSKSLAGREQVLEPLQEGCQCSAGGREKVGGGVSEVDKEVLGIGRAWGKISPDKANSMYKGPGVRES